MSIVNQPVFITPYLYLIMETLILILEWALMIVLIIVGLFSFAIAGMAAMDHRPLVKKLFVRIAMTLGLAAIAFVCYVVAYRIGVSPKVGINKVVMGGILALVSYIAMKPAWCMRKQANQLSASNTSNKKPTMKASVDECA